MARVIELKTRKVIVPEGGIDISPDVVAALAEPPDKVLADALAAGDTPPDSGQHLAPPVSPLTAQELHKKLCH